MPICNKEHRYSIIFYSLPLNQEGRGGHKCAGCAYELGFQAGKNFEEQIFINLNSLPESQAGTVRHKSPYATFVQGYFDGVIYTYQLNNYDYKN
jgi:hypothetical protein